MPFRGRRAAAQAVASLLLLGCGATDGGRDLAAQGSAGDANPETPVGQGNRGNNGAAGETNGGDAPPADVVSDGSTPTHEPDSAATPMLGWVSHQLADFAHCGDAELGHLAAACSDSERSPTIVANGDKLAPASVSLLELTGPEDLNRASVEFTPGTSQTFGIYLGTPNVPFSISIPERQIMPRCARYLPPELSERLTSASCSQLRGVYLVDVQAGVTYAFNFGPIAPQQWVRIYVQPLE